MAGTVLAEYRDKHSKRNYPFLDNADVTDSDGNTLSVDFILDMVLYPIGLTGEVYLSKIDLNSNEVVFSDTATSGEVARAPLGDENESVVVTEAIDFGRDVGVIVYGPSVVDVRQGNRLRLFTPANTTLTPATYIALNQPGVRGFLLEDGTLVTGDVTFVGEGGVTVSSFEEGDKKVVQFDIRGVAPPDLSDCSKGDLPPPITKIVIKCGGNGLLNVGQSGGLSFCRDRRDVCGSAKKTRLPDANGNLPGTPDNPCGCEQCAQGLDCNPDDPFNKGTPPVCNCVGEVVLAGKSVSISAPSAPNFQNALYVTPTPGGSQERGGGIILGLVGPQWLSS